MENKPKISVIIPVYSVEKYIERCARSLFEQTLDNIEYIFINDCTPDASIAILRSVLEEYPLRKDFVKIIDMEHNSGQAAVRKKGIESASGEYVIHCDSDDYIDKDMYRLMWETANKTSADIVFCDAIEVSPHGEQQYITNGGENSDYLNQVLTNQWGGVLWNKLVRRNIVRNNSIIMPMSNYWEDLALTIQYSILCKQWSYIQKGLYYYCRREDSIIGESKFSPSKHIDHTIQASRNYDIVVDAIERSGKGPQYEKHTIRRQLFIKNQLLTIMPFNGCTSLWKSLCGKSNWKILTSQYITNKERLSFIITYFGLYSLKTKITSIFMR